MENIKKAIIGFEREILETDDSNVKLAVDLSKMYANGFFYKGVEEMNLGLFKDAKLSFQKSIKLAEVFLGDGHEFYMGLDRMANMRLQEISKKEKAQKKHLINYEGQELVRKSTYNKAFEFSEHRLSEFRNKIPDEYKQMKIKSPEDTRNGGSGDSIELESQKPQLSMVVYNKIRYVRGY